MTFEYNLRASSFVKHADVVTLPEDEVIVRFKSDIYLLDELLVTVIAGSKKKQYKTKSLEVNILEVNISEHCKQAGAVTITASIIVGGQAVKTWSLEPIRIVEVIGNYEPLPELEALSAELQTLKQAVAELANSTL